MDIGAWASVGVLGGMLTLFGGMQAAQGWGGRGEGGGAFKHISGRATVVDGDTLKIRGRRLRLDGIDAPELRQTCQYWWFLKWRAGVRAKTHLQSLIANRVVRCTYRKFGKHGRPLVTCHVGGGDNRRAVNLNWAMVQDGMAWAFVKYSRRYQVPESMAHVKKRGVWKYNCRPAWAYREARCRATLANAPNKKCRIKGNVSKAGKIYHRPGDLSYCKTKINLRRGERWFCSEAEARRAGWTPARSAARAPRAHDDAARE